MRRISLVLLTAFATLGCAGLFATEGAATGECVDTIDNDGNGLTDCDDAGCVENVACTALGGDTDTDTDTDSDTDTDTDTDSDVAFDVSWSSNGLTLAIDGPSGSYDFGMAEETDNGWYGEDCLDGAGPNSGSWDLCHPMRDGDSLQTVHALEDLAEGETTIFNETISEAGHIAYILIGDDGCTVENDRQGYYDDEDCLEQ